jgi:hypothetical protein
LLACFSLVANSAGFGNKDTVPRGLSSLRNSLGTIGRDSLSIQGMIPDSHLYIFAVLAIDSFVNIFIKNQKS